MIAEFGAAIAGLRGASDIANGLIKLDTLAQVQGKAIELNQIILAAQGDIFAANAVQSVLIQRIADLEKELADVKAWEVTKQRYELKPPVEGVFVYGLKAEHYGTEPAHWICANCHESGRKSILQFSPSQVRMTAVACSHCKAQSLVKIHVAAVLHALGGGD